MTWTESTGGRLEDGGWQVTYTQRPFEEASDDPLLKCGVTHQISLQ